MPRVVAGAAMIHVVSAVYGDYDDIEPPPTMTDTRWVLVTDRPRHDLTGWEVVIEPHPHLHPRMAAKIPKCLPWRYTADRIQTEPDRYDDVVWLDTSARWHSPALHIAGLVEQVPPGGVGMFRHPWRSSILDEALDSAQRPKYEDQPLVEQVRYYQGQGFVPELGGLWACGAIVYRRRDEPFGRAWLHEQLLWSYQDQLAFPYLAWRRHQAVTDLAPGWHLDNPYFTFQPHAGGEGR